MLIVQKIDDYISHNIGLICYFRTCQPNLVFAVVDFDSKYRSEVEPLSRLKRGIDCQRVVRPL